MEIKNGIKKFSFTLAYNFYDKIYEAYVDEQGKILKFVIITNSKNKAKKSSETTIVNDSEFVFYTLVSAFAKLLDIWRDKEEKNAFIDSLNVKYSDLVDQKVFRTSCEEDCTFKDVQVIVDKKGRIAYIDYSLYNVTDEVKYLELMSTRGDLAFDTRVREFVDLFYSNNTVKEIKRFESTLCQEDKKKFIM